MKKEALFTALILVTFLTIASGQSNIFPSSGNAGIGTTTPAAKLTLNSPNGAFVDLNFSQGQIEKGVIGVAAATNHFFSGVGSNDFVVRATAGLLHLGANNGSGVPAATFLRNGNLGVGTISPSARLHTSGTVRFEGLPNDNILDRILVTDANGNVSYRSVTSIPGSAAGWGYGGNTVATLKSIGTVDNFDLPFITNNIERLRISSSGTVLIGTSVSPHSEALLAIKGPVYAQKIKVTQIGWADYVFDKQYILRSLTEVESFIKANHHLPDVPSAAQVEKEGLDLGSNQATLLQKIEELTLYLIEQNKKLLDQTKALQDQQKQIDAMKNQIMPLDR